MITITAETQLETKFGTFRFLVFQEKSSGKEHMVLVKPWASKVLRNGDSARFATPLVRIHSECATGDIFASTYCDCRAQLQKALRLIARQGGALLYLRQEGRGIGLTAKIKAYELQRKGLDTVEANRQLGRGADERGYGIAAEMLHQLGISTLRLLTNNPEKIKALQEQGFQVQRQALIAPMKTKRGKKYLRAKREKLKHRL